MTSEVTQPFWPQTHPLGIHWGPGLTKGQSGSLLLLSVPAPVGREGATLNFKKGYWRQAPMENSLWPSPQGSLGQVSATEEGGDDMTSWLQLWAKF